MPKRKEFPEIPNDTGIYMATVGDWLVYTSSSLLMVSKLLEIYKGCYEYPCISWNEGKQFNVSYHLECFANHIKFENLHYSYSRIAQYLQHKLPREMLPLYIGTIFEPIVAERLSKEDA